MTNKPQAGPWTELKPTKQQQQKQQTNPIPVGVGQQNVNKTRNKNIDVKERHNSFDSLNSFSPPSIALGLGTWHHGSASDLLKACEEECKNECNFGENEYCNDGGDGAINSSTTDGRAAGEIPYCLDIGPLGPAKGPMSSLYIARSSESSTN